MDICDACAQLGLLASNCVSKLSMLILFGDASIRVKLIKCSLATTGGTRKWKHKKVTTEKKRPQARQ